MTIAEMFLIGWACLATALWQYKVWQYKVFKYSTAGIIEMVVEGKAKFVIKDNGKSKTYSIEEVKNG
jgi:hypothetical protein